VQVARALIALRMYKPYGDGNVNPDPGPARAEDDDITEDDVRGLMADLLHYAYDRGMNVPALRADAYGAFASELLT
jgi:hypothetical protein